MSKYPAVHYIEPPHHEYRLWATYDGHAGSKMQTQQLTPSQAAALLDILSHHQVYREIRDFRHPGLLSEYGPPFKSQAGEVSATPSLQALVSKLVLNLPGLRDVSEDFWQEQINSMIGQLQDAELSESYDKGNMGTRKTLSTATSALIEYLVRGVFSGVSKLGAFERGDKYQTSSADDLTRAFRDFGNQIVYGTILDDLVAKAAETENLLDHLPIIQAAHEFILVNLASIMHYTLILSPKGQYLVTLIDYANKLVPYAIIKQTLKIGNVASMINAMMKVILAKMSVASVTNWMGLTQTADDGMNLMQHIISTVLYWDMREIKSKALKIEKDRNGLDLDQLTAIKEYLEMSREEHEGIRQFSEIESKSIVTVILTQASVSSPILSTTQHELALEYLAVQLSIRDREQIVKVLCHNHPDHLTTAVRDVVAAYEPIIRSVHNAVDLSETVTDFEHFLRDMLNISRIPGKHNTHDQAPTPTVGDFVQLLHKHQASCHKFLHQVAKNGKDVTKWYHEYARDAAGHFRRPETSAERTSADEGAGVLTPELVTMFSSLPESKRVAIFPILDAHAEYLSKLHDDSAARLAAVISSPVSSSPITKISSFHHRFQTLSCPSSRPPSSPSSRTSSPAPLADPSSPVDERPTVPKGPGAHLARWQALLDDTALTPATAEGAVRYGLSKETSTDTEPSSAVSEHDEDLQEKRIGELIGHLKLRTMGELGLEENKKVQRPDVKPVIDALLPQFKDVLAKKACNW